VRFGGKPFAGIGALFKLPLNVPDTSKLRAETNAPKHSDRRGSNFRCLQRRFRIRKTLARPIIAPPGIAPERLAVLKNAFGALAQDKDFLADAQSARLEVAPIWGEAVDKIIRLISSASPDTAARLGKAIGGR
jgi:hypothetical protein